MARNRNERWILVLLVLLLVGLPVTADSTMEGKNRDGGSPTDCDNCEEGDTDCCSSPDDPNGDFKCGVHTVVGCDSDGTGGLEHLMLCVEGGLGGWPGIYNVVQIPDGISIEYTDGTEVECIGFRDSSETVGMIRLRHPDSGKVAKIDKFIEAPIGPTTSNPIFTAVYIDINGDTFVIQTSAGMLLTDLNDAIENAIATKYNVTVKDDYWIVGTKLGTAEFVDHVMVRADDEGLVTMDVELRPVRWNPAQYDISCGEPGF